MTTLHKAWAIAFLTAGVLTGCTGGSTEAVTPSQLTAEQEAAAELEQKHVANEEMLHQQQEQNPM